MSNFITEVTGKALPKIECRVPFHPSPALEYGWSSESFVHTACIVADSRIDSRKGLGSSLVGVILDLLMGQLLVVQRALKFEVRANLDFTSSADCTALSESRSHRVDGKGRAIAAGAPSRMVQDIQEFALQRELDSFVDLDAL